MSESCIFCAIAADRAPAEIICREAGALAFLDIHPTAPGHTLVIPRRHVASYFELSDDEAAACFDLIKKVKASLDGEHSPGGYKIGINIGRPSGQSIMHVHIHVVPMGEKGPGRRSEVFTRGEPA